MRDFLAGGDSRERVVPGPARDRLAAVGRCLRGAFPAEEEDEETARLLALLGGEGTPLRADDNPG